MKRFRALLILAALVLAACNTSTPRERIVTKTASIPISTPCKVVLPPEEPLAGSTVDLSSDVFDLVKALLVERTQRQAREATLTAAVEACR